MANDLTRPLGLAKPPPGQRRLRLVAGTVLGLAAIAGIALLSSVILGDPGESEAIVMGTIDKQPEPPAASISQPFTATGLIELIPDGALSQVNPANTHRSTSAAPQLSALPRPDLIEDGPYGSLPRISVDGTRPLEAYARPLDVAATGAGLSRVAIIVTGIADPASDSRAALELPGTVTLAFAPYGEDLAGFLDRARRGGHEILLQIPLEPYGYPNNDPGPHTLTVDASAPQNLDRLHWLMSRISNYVGVINFLGARFTSDDAALAPALAEIGERGLLYLDDGTSPTSRAGILASDRMPFLQADIVLDAVTEAAAIDERLDEAATIAARQGYAIAIGTAFPVTIERIAAFAGAAAERGIAIVPVTALIDNEKAL